MVYNCCLCQVQFRKISLNYLEPIKKCGNHSGDFHCLMIYQSQQLANLCLTSQFGKIMANALVTSLSKSFAINNVMFLFSSTNVLLDASSIINLSSEYNKKKNMHT